MKSVNVKKMALTSVFTAISVIGSTFSVPILGAKCAPVQHIMNIMGAVFLGPAYALAAAFLTSCIRNITGLGTLLAFPGSMCGALLSALLYKKTKSLLGAYAGEVIGTGIVGGLLAYPFAVLLMGNAQAAVFTFVVPFLISTGTGTVMAGVILAIVKRKGLHFLPTVLK